jgi:hypothetical protein
MGQEPRARPLDREPRVVGLHQGQRTQSAPTGRTYDRRPPTVHRRNKNACQGARPHMTHSTPAVRGTRDSRSDCTEYNWPSGRIVTKDRPGASSSAPTRRRRTKAVGAGGGRRAQGGDERAYRNFCLHFSVLGGLAPRLSSAVICNKSVSYKIGLTQDGPPQVIVWTKCVSTLNLTLAIRYLPSDG